MTKKTGWRVNQAAITSGQCLGSFEVLRSLRRYLCKQSQEHYTVDRLEERVKGRERAIADQTNTETLKATLETFMRYGIDGCIFTGFSECADTILN